MHRFTICAALIVLLVFSSRPAAQIAFSYVNYEKYFAGVTGAFVIHDFQKNITLRNSEPNAAKQYPPCSTLDILTALAGLQAGALQDANSTVSNTTLAAAMQKPADAFFQDVAAKVGQAKMQTFLNAAEYGNKDMTGLLISPNEQVRFLAGLYTNRLSFDANAMEIVRGLLIRKKDSRHTLSGRSGQCVSGNSNVAWHVGHMKTKSGEYVFATSMEGGSTVTAAKAESVTRSILAEMRLL